MKIVASGPGDIVIEFVMKAQSNSASDTVSGAMAHYSIPVKTLSASKSIEISKEYGTGSHQDYAEVYGKIGYEGDFTIGTWYVSAEENPSTWDDLVKNYLTYSNDDGLPQEFEIRVHARGGSAMTRVGTGTYVSGTTNSDNMVIETYKRCSLKGDSVDVPESGTLSRKYSFSAMRRYPP